MHLTRRWRPLKPPTSWQQTRSNRSRTPESPPERPQRPWNQLPTLNEWTAVFNLKKETGLGEYLTPRDVERANIELSPSPLDYLPHNQAHAFVSKPPSEPEKKPRVWLDKFPLVAGNVHPENVLILRGLNKNLVEEDFTRITLWKNQISPVVRGMSLMIHLFDDSTL